MASLISKHSIIYFVLLLHCFVGTLQGCQTTQAQPTTLPPSKQTTPSTPKTKHQKATLRLFDSILEVLNEKKIPIYLQDEDALLILSEYKPINTEIRQRYIIRVFSTSRGLLFRVRSLYERRDHRKKPPVWIEQKKSNTQSYRDEQNLGKAIRTRFGEK